MARPQRRPRAQLRRAGAAVAAAACALLARGGLQALAAWACRPAAARAPLAGGAGAAEGAWPRLRAAGAAGREGRRAVAGRLAASDDSKAEPGDVASTEESVTGGTVWINRPGQRSFEVRWAAGDTVGDLKEVIREATSVPRDLQELRCNGAELFPDTQSLEDWALANGGLTATVGGKAPDIWLFDERSEEERAAVEPPAGFYEEEEGIDYFRIFFYAVLVLPLTVYVATQAAGINPFVNPTPEDTEYEYVDDLLEPEDD